MNYKIIRIVFISSLIWAMINGLNDAIFYGMKQDKKSNWFVKIFFKPFENFEILDLNIGSFWIYIVFYGNVFQEPLYPYYRLYQKSIEFLTASFFFILIYHYYGIIYSFVFLISILILFYSMLLELYYYFLRPHEIKQILNPYWLIKWFYSGSWLFTEYGFKFKYFVLSGIAGIVISFLIVLFSNLIFK